MIPEPTSTAASTSSEDNANSHAEATSSGAVNHPEDDSGNENRQKQKRRKRVLKGSESVKGKNNKGSSRTGGRKGKQNHVEVVTLYEVLSMGKSAMQTVISDWIEAYMTDRDSSLLDLISFFIQCSGCKGVVTAEMCQSKVKEVKDKMVEELDEGTGVQYKKFLAFPWILTVTWPTDADPAEYPLVQSGPYGRWFHSEFCDFVSMLVAQCQHAVLFDGYLMNALISLLTELSDSYIRAFRHTCTLAAVKLLSSLVSVALSHDVAINNSQKLCDVQKTKTARQKNTQQLERLKKKVTELQEKRAEIESMMDIIFKGVFLKRYRDVLPEIRCICVEELGLWMKRYSSAFLNDSYLKYMGWMMHDKIPDVRIKSVLALQFLYGDPLLLPKLDLFTSRFKERMISMTLDKDGEVAVQAMKLLLLISKMPEDVFTPEDYKLLLQCVYSSQRPLAAIAGELLFSRFLSAAAPATDSQEEMNEEMQKLQSFAKLKALLQFFQESEIHKHVVYLVDSLWDCGGALLKDWPMFTAALLQDASLDHPGFTRTEQALIVEILVASVRQASEGSVLVGRGGGKKVMSAREKKIQTDDCLKLTEYLLTVLPTLLSKFSRSSDIVASLLRIPQFFVPQCPQAENTQVLSSLMEGMEAVLDQHSGSGVLETAARTYLSLCEDETPWCSTARSSRRCLLQRWVEQLKAQLDVALKSGRFSADEEQKREILKTLKKLRTFYNCHDLSHLNLFDLLFPLLSVESDQDTPPPEVRLEVLQCLGYSILWDLNNSQETLACREKAAAQRLRLRLFCERSHRSLTHSDHAVSHQAFLGVCDVLTAHSYQLQVWEKSTFSPLLYTPSPKLQRALLNFLHVHVFVVQECDSQAKVSEGSDVERLEDLHRRRNMLAAYCKLIVHGVLEMSLASEVFMHYVKYYNDFGDIIKETMCQTRQMDKIENARTVDLCLQQLFVRLKREQGSGSRSHLGVQTFSCIKELGRRFALTFSDPAKFRECVVLIHRNGIEFVFQEFTQTPGTTTPVYLSYLTILSEFSSKLLKPDKRTVLAFLVKHTAEHIINLREESWQPLVYYRASLLAAAEGEDGGSYVSSDRRNNPPSRSPSARHKLEGSKSFSPADSKASKGPRSSFSPSSHQEQTPQTDALANPPAKKPSSEAIVSISYEPDDDTVDVEL